MSVVEGTYRQKGQKLVTREAMKTHDSRRTITETENLLFSPVTRNPQPLDLDVEAAKARLELP